MLNKLESVIDGTGLLGTLLWENGSGTQHWLTDCTKKAAPLRSLFPSPDTRARHRNGMLFDYKLYRGVVALLTWASTAIPNTVCQPGSHNPPARPPVLPRNSPG